MGETRHLIAQANANEIGESLHGVHGDQKGFELNARQWYSYPWDYIYRPKNAEDADIIADFMEKAVCNGFIGYDTNMNKRDTLYNGLLQNGYKVDELNVNSATDCSALAFCAIYAATNIPYPTQEYYNANPEDNVDIKKCPRIRHYEFYMKNYCADKFEKLGDKEELLANGYAGEEAEAIHASYADTADNLKRGDILVALGKHIGVWI